MLRRSGARRRLIKFAAAASLLLFLTLMLAWASSRGYLYALTYDGAGSHFQLASGNGVVEVMCGFSESGRPNGDDAPRRGWETHRVAWREEGMTLYEMGTAWPQRLGFKLLSFTVPATTNSNLSPGTRVVNVFAPHWSLAALAAVMPTAYLVRARLLRRRAAAGCCAACGYDLRATPEKWPECGKLTSRGPAASSRHRAVAR